MASALDGIKVLDLSSGAAAALATMFLGDHGAKVTRIVGVGAPAARDGGFVIWDRGKACVALDLDAAMRGMQAGTASPGEAAAAAAFRALVAAADIAIEDFAPSSARQSLVDAAWLTSLNPRLVSCSITAYGKHGPMKDEPPIDDLVLAYTGVLGGMPAFRPPPVHVVHPLPSVGAALFACSGVAAALLARETTGRGRAVATSLMAGALLYHPKVIGERLARHVFQTHPSGSAPFYSNYRCADGNSVQLGCVHVNFIAVAAKLIGLGELILEPRFDKGRGGKTPKDDAEIRAAVAQVMATKSSADWMAAFEAADVPFAPCRQAEDGLGDAQVLHNGMVVTLDDPVAGPVVQMGVPVRLTGTPGRVAGPRQIPLPLRGQGLGVGGQKGSVQSLIADYANGSFHLNPDHLNPAPAPAKGRAEVDPLPLAGVRILEITNLIAGPTAGRILADLGADVIKLEPHEGDMSRPIGRTYFYSVNFNKRSISVDTRTAAGKLVVQRIATKADALVANLRPGATERMGIVPAINPRLIETHITGYGWTGPYAHRPGIDPLAQALMGLQRAQGGPDNPPVFPAQLAPTDYTTGAMGAFGTILALYERARNGTVQRVDSDLLSGGIVLSSAWFSRYAGKPERPLADKEQMGLGPFHRLYQLQDGWIYLVAADDVHRRAVCTVAGVAMPDAAGLAPPAGGHSNAAPIARTLADAFASRSVADTLAALKKSGVPVVQANEGHSEIFLGDRQALDSGLVTKRQHPKAGTMTVAWNYVQFLGTALSAGRPTPLLGEQTDEILSQIGYSDAEIRALHASNVVKKEAV